MFLYIVVVGVFSDWLNSRYYCASRELVFRVIVCGGSTHKVATCSCLISVWVLGFFFFLAV